MKSAPPFKLSSTLTPPGAVHAGVVQVIRVEDRRCAESLGPAWEPNLHCKPPPINPAPKMLSIPPPEIDPMLGISPIMVGTV